MHDENLLVKNVQFVVQPGGRDRVRALGKKLVHAGVKGEIVTDPIEAGKLISSMPKDKTAYYNPYKVDSFVDGDGKKLETAGVVLLTSVDGKPRLFFQEAA